MSIAASGADARLGYICGCAVWTSGCVPAGLIMLGGKSRKPQKQG
jgi:hypothetical protein